MKKNSKRKALPLCAVFLAGGRGTRFWPRSRMRTPKQLLNIVGQHTMLRETIKRFEPIIPSRNLWVVTNSEQAAAVRREMRGSPASQVLAEPLGRNTAAAIGLAAVHLLHRHGDALMAVLPSDSYIADVAKYRKLVRAALELARTAGNLVVLGVPPSHPETGYGYIESGPAFAQPLGVTSYSVRRFTEKPDLKTAQEYAASGKYFWNAGMFFWRASTFLDNLKQFLPATHRALVEIGHAIGTKRYAGVLRKKYGQLENISVDYAIMEPATRLEGPPRVSVIPAEVGWSDIGSWAAVYELLAAKDGAGANVSAGPSFCIDAQGNYFWSPKKLVAAIGVRDLVLVETADALLVCSRDRSQDVGKIVKWLEEKKHRKLI